MKVLRVVQTDVALVKSCMGLMVVVALGVLSLVDGGAGSAWNYNYSDASGGPQYWYKTYTECGGVMQSPIDVQSDLVIYDKNLEFFDFSEYSVTQNVVMVLENVGGHTAEVIFHGADIHLKGGGLPDKYKLLQFHFHWGMEDRRGSEHKMDGETYPMEIHFVHYQAHQPNATVAQEHPFGLAVVAFFIKVGAENKNYNKILDYFDKITNATTPDANTTIPTFPVKDLLPNKPTLHYMRYQGSLTTPPCYESVIWSIGTDVIELSEAQITKFRNLYDEEHHHLVDDYRPTQPLNERFILTTMSKYGSGNGSAALHSAHLCLVLAAAVASLLRVVRL